MTFIQWIPESRKKVLSYNKSIIAGRSFEFIHNRALIGSEHMIRPLKCKRQIENII